MSINRLKLATLFEKAKRYPYHAVSPVGKGPDPRTVSPEEYGYFMRLPVGNSTNRWYFETDAHRDLFVARHKHLEVSGEN
jgi:hypothetical protein